MLWLLRRSNRSKLANLFNHSLHSVHTLWQFMLLQDIQTVGGCFMNVPFVVVVVVHLLLLIFWKIGLKKCQSQPKSWFFFSSFLFLFFFWKSREKKNYCNEIKVAANHVSADSCFVELWTCCWPALCMLLTATKNIFKKNK